MPTEIEDMTSITLGEIGRTMNRMDARMERVVEDHEQRLRRVERWMYVIPPTIITAGVSVALAILNRVAP